MATRPHNSKWYSHGGNGWSTYGGYRWYRYAAHGWTTYAGYHWYSLARLLTIGTLAEVFDDICLSKLSFIASVLAGGI